MSAEIQAAVSVALVAECGLSVQSADEAAAVVMEVLDQVAFKAEPFLAAQVRSLRDACETMDKRVLSTGFEIAALRDALPNRLPRISCPECGSDVALTKTDKIHSHRRGDGIGGRCAASGADRMPTLGESA